MARRKRPPPRSVALLLSACASAAVALDREGAFIGYSESGAGAAAPCADDSEHCASWAEKGECVRNPAYMLESCRAACRTCKPSLSPPAAAAQNSPATVVLRTSAGDVRLSLDVVGAPATAAWFKSAAGDKCVACELYRAEGIPEPGAKDNFGGPGPPYALVQGRARTGGFRALPKEAAPIVRRGMVARIGEGPDFFVAIRDHAEWGHAHTVFGKVADDASMEVVDSIPKLPTRQETWGQTHVTTLVEKLPFELVVEPEG